MAAPEDSRRKKLSSCSLAPALKPSGAYVIKEKNLDRSAKAFTQLIGQDNAVGLCVSRFCPADVEKSHGINASSFVWLSDTLNWNIRGWTESHHIGEGGVKVINPKKISELAVEVHEFLCKNKNAIVLLEGLDCLLAYNDLDAVIRLVYSLRDGAALSGNRLIVSLDPDLMDGREVAAISRDLWEL